MIGLESKGAKFRMVVVVVVLRGWLLAIMDGLVSGWLEINGFGLELGIGW